MSFSTQGELEIRPTIGSPVPASKMKQKIRLTYSELSNQDNTFSKYALSVWRQLLLFGDNNMQIYIFEIAHQLLYWGTFQE
jgi:hypothetical protein